MFPRWKYSLFQSWFRRTLAFQKPLTFLSKITNCFTNIFDSKQLKYSPKVYIFAASTRKWQLKKKWAAIFGQRRQIAHLLVWYLFCAGSNMCRHKNFKGSDSSEASALFLFCGLGLGRSRLVFAYKFAFENWEEELNIFSENKAWTKERKHSARMQRKGTCKLYFD
jgi:hypothetical protein